MSGIDENQWQGTQCDVTGREAIADLLGVMALLVTVTLFLWALWRAMQPVLMTWCSLAQFAT